MKIKHILAFSVAAAAGVLAFAKNNIAEEVAWTIGNDPIYKSDIEHTYQDMLQRAVVFVVTVVCALGNGTLDASVCMAAHTWFLLCNEFGFSLTRKQESILEIKPIYTWWKGKQNPFLYDLFLTDFLGGN